jgi:hypothetical protein
MAFCGCLAGIAIRFPSSFRDAPSGEGPESIAPSLRWEKWIPGSLALLAPRNDGENFAPKIRFSKPVQR